MLPIITRLVVLESGFRHPVLPDSDLIIRDLDLIIRDLDWAVIKLSPCSSLHLQYRHIHVPCLKQIVRCCKIGENSRSKALCICKSQAKLTISHNFSWVLFFIADVISQYNFLHWLLLFTLLCYKFILLWSFFFVSKAKIAQMFLGRKHFLVNWEWRRRLH